MFWVLDTGLIVIICFITIGYTYEYCIHDLVARMYTCNQLEQRCVCGGMGGGEELMRGNGSRYCFQAAFCDVIRSVMMDASFNTGRPCYGASLRQLALVKLTEHHVWKG